MLKKDKKNLVSYINGTGDCGFSSCTLFDLFSYIRRRSAILLRFDERRFNSESGLSSPSVELPDDSELFDSKSYKN